MPSSPADHTPRRAGRLRRLVRRARERVDLRGILVAAALCAALEAAIVGGGGAIADELVGTAKPADAPTPIPAVPTPPTAPAVPAAPTPAASGRSVLGAQSKDKVTRRPSTRRRAKRQAPKARRVPVAKPAPTATPAPAKPAKPGKKRGCRKDSTSSRGCGKKRKAPKPKTPRPSRPTTPAAPPMPSAATAPARIGVPSFFIDRFRIPPFLLPIYQAAGVEYGVRWEVLAAINEIETDYGRNLNVSSAGALGWMQFMPGTWRAYGVDANHDRKKDPFNPVDAIFAAARYLRAAGAESDLRRAIFAYNHADWYVDSVLERARLIGGLPTSLVGSLTGLTQGRFPVYGGKPRYTGQVDVRARRTKRGRAGSDRLPEPRSRRQMRIRARPGAGAVAVNDGRVVRIGKTRRLGRFIQLQDVYGNTYTYGHLRKIAATYPAPRQRKLSRKAIAKELALPRRDARPAKAASKTRKVARDKRAASRKPRTAASRAAKERLFAHPTRRNARAATRRAQQPEKVSLGPLKLNRRDYVAKRLERGARVVAGTVLGRLGRGKPGERTHLLFEIRPAGRGAPRIDPKPILDGWRLLESTALYGARDDDPFSTRAASRATIGQLLLMGKDVLARRVLADKRIKLYGCGRRDIRTGQVDRRVLATLAYLAASGLEPTVSSLRCGHRRMTTSGNVSEHSSGNAVDIAAINGTPILGHQGPGSIGDQTVQRLLTLQGTLKPHQIISLMRFSGADNTLALADHADHIHIGWRPQFGANRKAARAVASVLKPSQWRRLIRRLGSIDNPLVRLKPSRYAIETTRRADRGRGD